VTQLPDLSIVIPAFNERDRLPGTLMRLDRYFESVDADQSIEIIVVDDGSSDGTDAAVRDLRLPNSTPTTIVVHEVNRGKGAAVRSGFAASSGRWVLLSDADLSAPIEGLDILKAGAHPDGIAIGSRAIDRDLVKTPQPPHRDFMGRIFNLVVRILGLSGFHDTQCGFKLFPGEVARHLAAAQRIDGFAFDVELLLLAQHWGVAVKEVGVTWHHVEASRVLPLRHAGQMLRDLFRLFWWRTTEQLAPAPILGSAGLGNE
jgi:dolichyl-phosphate beta-glucosyltransferase